MWLTAARVRPSCPKAQRLGIDLIEVALPKRPKRPLDAAPEEPLEAEPEEWLAMFNGA